ncbi:DUF7524 family protein [Halanaeroarchaeum sulfurireducens]|uniref:Uncharacterized protein n=1 Tax=Halanaeroarchaeum sulfurireducens TaxID=1604004 RepID=A0A0F7PC71_9EURY|nr:hypothetical protein [Halanaeroarchaeum sulfurireducens]AKH97785.1 hypothetical protein HLASF_1299 [Halanaeroarchaeum sulfurireducens]ALG82180.1 hypothetical protein HLASA_1287 [Halanaeroarchaeum sulfurireducens]
MAQTLRVHVNRDEPRSVEPEAPSIDVDGPFDLVLDNHGPSTHVHVHVDDTLATATDIAETNWYVEAGETETIPVAVESIYEVAGRLELSTGYGAEREVVEVTVAAGSGGVEVDDELGTIQPDTDPEPTDIDTYVVGGTFVAIGLVAAVALAFLVEDVAAVLTGLLVIVGAVGASLYLLVSS